MVTTTDYRPRVALEGLAPMTVLVNNNVAENHT